MEVTTDKDSKAWQFFWAVTAHPVIILVSGLLIVVGFAWFVPTLEKDTRADAFIPDDHPALVFNNRTEDIFGLGDPMVLAIINDDKHGIFNPHTLALIEWLSQELEHIDNIDPERITSIATQNNIVGTEEGMEITPFFEQAPVTLIDAQAVRASVMGFPLYVGTLVSEDGTGALIIAELIDQTDAQPAYEALLELIERAPIAGKETIHVAGEGAVAGHFGDYIDTDAARLNPISFLVITVLCFIAFRTLRGALVPNVVVLATLAFAIGLMACVGTQYFVITNALPVVLIGIAVADSIHILTEYYEQAARHPNLSSRELSVTAMVRIWRAITLTTVTTIAGFFGLAIASIMPPMMYFGLYAAAGVAMAWLFSLTVVPAILTLLNRQSSPAYIVNLDITVENKGALTTSTDGQVDSFGKAVSTLGILATRFPHAITLGGIALIIAGLHGGSKIVLDETLIRGFDENEPIVIADTAINKAFAGTTFFDIMIETPEIEGLFIPENLEKMAELQRYMETHPDVGGTKSIVDYLKQMNRAINADQDGTYRLPEQLNLIAQYFLLYSATGDPTDFDEVIDYDYRLANIRVYLKTDRYTTVKKVIEYFDAYATTKFDSPEIAAFAAGRANVKYHWMKRIGQGHFLSISVALSLVLIMAAISFRSFAAGVFCLTPILVTVLGVYAYMGYTGLWLSVSSSMFAAIAIGLGVDFSIHTVASLQTVIKQGGDAGDLSLISIYNTTGRALLFNFLALALGFGTLMLSKIVILREFGSTVALAVTLSFLISLTLLPALAKLIKPRFLGYHTSVVQHEAMSRE
jgi:hypothetical protein